MPDPLEPAVAPPSPRDRYTAGTKVWVGILTAAGVTEAFGLWIDRAHPGNRGKWTLTSNVLTWFGWDSVTGQPVAVRFGKIRRSALVMILAWLTAHWTFPVRKRDTY